MTPLLEHMAPMQPCPSTLRGEAEADGLGGKVWDRQAGTRVHKFTDSRRINLIIFLRYVYDSTMPSGDAVGTRDDHDHDHDHDAFCSPS